MCCRACCCCWAWRISQGGSSKTRVWAWFAVILSLTILYDWTLGGVELYYNTFQASNLAKGIGVWALISFLDRKLILSIALTVLITFIQIIVGLDMMITLALILLQLTWIRKEVSWPRLISLLSFYGLIAGSFLVWIYLARESQTATISSSDYFQLMFDFRHPHHFILASFPIKNILFFSICTFASLIYFKDRQPLLFHFVLVSFIITIFYWISVDFMHLISVGNFQWYKMTIWTKFLGVVALFGLVGNVLPSLNHLLSWRWMNIALVLGSIVFLTITMGFNQYLPFHTTYHFGDYISEDPLLDICTQIKDEVPEEAVFIQPFEVTALKYYAERSSYVEFKANVRTPDGVSAWYPRIQQVYGVNTDMDERGFELQEIANTNYYDLDFRALMLLREEGVTHMITSSAHDVEGCVLVLENEEYRVYQIE